MYCAYHLAALLQVGTHSTMVLADGVLYSLGAVLSWGTALIFLKFGCVKRNNLSSEVMVLHYSIGYLVSSVVAIVVLAAIGEPPQISIPGLVGGLLWGVGKLCIIFAVTSDIGLAIGQAVQCCCNVGITFISGLYTGESVWWVQVIAVLVLALGCLALSAPGMGFVQSWLSPHVSHDFHDLESTDIKSEGGADPTLSPLTGLLLAIGAGVFMGLQAVPFKLGEHVDSWSYAVNESFGQFFVLTIASVTIQFCRGTLRTCCVGFRVGSLAGLAGGGLLFAAATFNTFAVKQIGLVGSCIGQANLIVAGLWGIMLFKEITNWRLIGLWSCGALLTMLGAVGVQIQPP